MEMTPTNIKQFLFRQLDEKADAAIERRGEILLESSFTTKNAVRKGKPTMRVKKSKNKQFKMVRGDRKLMSHTEQRNRRTGAKTGAHKRKATQGAANIHRKASVAKRKRFGVK